MPSRSLVGLWALGAILVVAGLSRFAGLGAWPLEGDEVFTYRRAAEHDFLRSNPGIYLIDDLVFRAFGASELTARVPSAVFGVLGILALWWLGREVRGPRAGLFAAALGTVSYWHLYQSQQARFYTAAFLFAALAYACAHRGWRRGSLRIVSLAVGLGCVAVLFHGTCFLLLALLGVFWAIVALFARENRDTPSVRVAVVATWIHVAVGVVCLPFGVWLLMIWVRDSSGAIGGWGKSPALQVLAWAKYVTLPVALAAAAGAASTLRVDRWLGVFLGLFAVGPLAFLVVGSAFVDMRPDFAFFALPAWLTLAAIFCDDVCARLPGRPVLAGACTLLVFLPQGPEFVSHYTGKRSLDVREVVEFVVDRAGPDDAVLTFDADFKFYLDSRVRAVPWLGTALSEGWDEKLAQIDAETNGTIWVVLRRRRDAIHPTLRDWLFASSRLVFEAEARRFDYSVDRIQVFRAAPER